MVALALTPAAELREMPVGVVTVCILVAWGAARGGACSCLAVRETPPVAVTGTRGRRVGPGCAPGERRFRAHGALHRHAAPHAPCHLLAARAAARRAVRCRRCARDCAGPGVRGPQPRLPGQGRHDREDGPRAGVARRARPVRLHGRLRPPAAHAAPRAVGGRGAGLVGRRDRGVDRAAAAWRRAQRPCLGGVRGGRDALAGGQPPDPADAGSARGGGARPVHPDRGRRRELGHARRRGGPGPARARRTTRRPSASRRRRWSPTTSSCSSAAGRACPPRLSPPRRGSAWRTATATSAAAATRTPSRCSQTPRAPGSARRGGAAGSDPDCG